MAYALVGICEESGCDWMHTSPTTPDFTDITAFGAVVAHHSAFTGHPCSIAKVRVEGPLPTRICLN